jgi:2-hydroxy-3-keto-5-methylthiopentenyl-1-phosphate phosphatase
MKKPAVQVFCDFDGTVTKGDTIDVLLEALADNEWRKIEERWVRGEISGRECMSLQVPLIRGGWPAMLKVLDTVEVDNSFATFVNWCNLRKIEISIVSDGIDQVIAHLLKREGIQISQIYANKLVDRGDGRLGLEFPSRGTRIVCPTGQCKCQVLDQAPTNMSKVVIGDGRSDFCWSRNSDILFAKDKLAKYCLANSIPHNSFDNFVQIRVALEEMMSTAAAKATSKTKKFAEVPLLAQS